MAVSKEYLQEDDVEARIVKNFKHLHHLVTVIREDVFISFIRSKFK